MPAFILTIVDVIRVDDAFRQYVKSAAEMTAKHGGLYILRGKPDRTDEAIFEGKSVILTQFPSQAALEAFQVDYATLAALREGSGAYQAAVFYEKD